ncbi:hypothetical protein F5883DRAFT_575408, partial [Diaporthe sp. PMI_573]
MEISSFPFDIPLPDPVYLSDQTFFIHPEYDTFSAQDHSVQPPSTLPPSPRLGAFAEDGYQSNQRFGIKQSSPLNYFIFNPVSSQSEFSQATLLRYPASPLVDRAVDDQIISTIDPHHSSALITHDDINFDDFCNSPTAYSTPPDGANQSAEPTVPLKHTSSEKASHEGDNLAQMRNENDNSLADTSDTSVLELNTPADMSIMVASDNPGPCLDETNHSEVSSIEEASASVQSALLPSTHQRSGKCNPPKEKPAALKASANAYKCGYPQCNGKSYLRKEHLKRHCNEAHSDNPETWRCQFCEIPKTFGRRDNFRDHLKRHVKPFNRSGIRHEVAAAVMLEDMQSKMKRKKKRLYV